ncbi:MAG: hypothetical protein IT353_06690 [Gemmatimonadaceae bacterium]|nr:hypothetical protein [Gemmatimonadaceae bacterium]
MPTSRVWRAIVWFEVRYQMRVPLFFLITGVLSVLLVLAGADNDASGRLLANAPGVILEQLLKWMYVILFLVTANVASAATRDFERDTAALFVSKPVTQSVMLTARFVGALVVSALPYVIGTIALAVGALLPSEDPARFGPFQLAPYIFGLGVLVLPTLVGLGAVFYALATWTRNTLTTFAGVIAFFAVSATTNLATARFEPRWIGQLLDPLGTMALSDTLKYWTVEQLNTSTPAFSGVLMWNRLLWLAIGFGVLAITAVRSDPLRTLREEGLRKTSPKEDVAHDSPVPTRAHPTPRVLERSFSRRTIALQFADCVRREVVRVFQSLPFIGVLTLGIFLLIQSATSAGNLFGMPVYPRTYLMLESLQGLYSVVLLLVVVLYSGEAIWRERTLAIHETLDAVPTPNAVFFGAKLAALTLIIVAYLAAGVVALITFQFVSGYHPIQLTLYVQGIAIAAAYPLLMMFLACFAHLVASNKFVGHGLVLAFIVMWDVLEELGFEHHLYRYASLPQTPYSDMSGYGPFLRPFLWFGLYWGLVGLVVIALSILFWRRGTDDGWRSRVGEARGRFGGGVRTVLASGSVGALMAACWIFYNTNVLNAYVPTVDAERAQASYERAYRQHRDLAMPRIVAVHVNVDIFPEQQRVDIRGQYRLRNKTPQPLRDIHISIPARARLKSLHLPPHDVTLQDTALGYHIVRLRMPLAPGDSLDVRFEVIATSSGFVNNGAVTSVVNNGTYFTKRDFFPVIGYDAQRQLVDAGERRQQGLEPILHFASIDSARALRQTPRASDADRVAFDVTVSTQADQIAVTSGELQRQWTANGRRYFHYTADEPITHHFAFVSASYEVRRSEWNGVALEIYHHPSHGVNVGRMMHAARQSLAYYTQQFGPYQHKTLRIVEFPRYERDATSLPGMVVFSESMGFNAKLTGDEDIDYPFYVTAHEVAHQWWGHQLVAANVQGAATLHETLAQYSALMVMEREFGRAGIRSVLAYEHDQYLRGRGSERGGEASLARAERQEYVYYHKGARAMYTLRDAIGEESLNSALSSWLAAFAMGEGPYATTRDLAAALRPTLPTAAEALFDDLFGRIILHDNRLLSATSVRRADGSFLVRVDVQMRKFEVDSSGTEGELPAADVLEIGFLGSDGAERDRLLSVERRTVSPSLHSFAFVVAQRPTQVLLDPYFRFSDRQRGDNMRAVVTQK